MIFVYGFGPYEEFEDNITGAILERLGDGLRERSRVFETVFDAAMFEAAFETARPRYILGLGQCRRGDKLRVETTARNARAERHAEPVPIDPSVTETQQRLRWELPLHELCEASEDAGAYVCNFSMWVAERWARANAARFAFVHVPRRFDPALAAGYVESVLPETPAPGPD